MVNVPLFTEVMLTVFENDHQWDQHRWGVQNSCGTTACIAGHTAIISSERPYRQGEVKVHWMSSRSGGDMDYVEVDGCALSVQAFAAEALGLEWLNAADLFHTMSKAEVWEYVEAITHGEVTLDKIRALSEARHRSDDPVRTEDEETDGRGNDEPRMASKDPSKDEKKESKKKGKTLHVVMHDVPTRQLATAGTRVTA